MMELGVEEKIKKCIKFIRKNFDKAVIEVKNIKEKSLYINLMGDEYEIVNEYSEKCNGILIIQNGENNFYDFKESLKEIPEYFQGNGIVFLRYEMNEYDDPDYISNQFYTYFKLNKYSDVDEYKVLSESGEISGLFIIAKYHINILDKETEYEDYTSNFFVNKSGCQGCKSGGGNCKTCEKHCCKK